MEDLELNSIKLSIEAILFQLSQRVSFQEICKHFPEISIDILRALLDELMRDYDNRDSIFEIRLNSDDSYLFQVRAPVLNHPKVRVFTHGKQFDARFTEVLAFIALNQPINLHDIIEFLGNRIVSIVNSLEDQGYIRKERNNNEESAPYITTALFADYMGIPNDMDVIKQAIQSEFECEQQKQIRKTFHKQKAKKRSTLDEISEAEIHAAAEKFDAIY